MKKIILITAFLCGFIAANAQYTYIAQRYDWLAGLFRALGLPAGDSAQFQTSQRQRAGSVYYDSVGVDAGLYAWTGLTWQLIGSGGSQTLQEVFDTEPGGSILTKTDSILIPHTGNLRIYGQYVPLILESDSAQGIIVRTRHPQANLLFATKTSTDISTVTSEVTIQKFSTGTVTNGYGTRVKYDLESANGTGRMASEYQTIWSNATDANRTSFVRIRAMNNGIEDTVMDIQPDYIIVHNGDDTLATLDDVRSGAGSTTANLRIASEGEGEPVWYVRASDTTLILKLFHDTTYISWHTRPDSSIYALLDTAGLRSAFGAASYTFSTGLTESAGTVTANLSTGVSGGQSVIGGTASGNSLTLSSTAHATKGNIVMGTSAYDEVNNRLGVGISIPTGKLHVQAGALASGGAAIRGSVTIPSNVGTLSAYELFGTGSGSTSQTLINVNGTLSSGYTGAGSTVAGLFHNLSAGTGTGTSTTTGNVSYRPVGVIGLQGRAEQTTTGNTVGATLLGGGGNVSIGAWAAATGTKNSGTNVAVAAFGRNAGTTPIQVAGFFALADYGASMPTFTSAALIADNAAQTDPIFLGRDNGTTVFSIADGGNVSVTGNLSLAAAGNKLNITTGSNASIGVSAAMTAGTITISTTAVTASSKIFLTHASLGGTQGILSVGTITAGTSFVINSSNAADTGTVNWWIIN